MSVFLCVHAQVDFIANREAIAFIRFQQNPTMSYGENVAFFRHVVRPSIEGNASILKLQMRGPNAVFLILHSHPVIALPYSVSPCALFSVRTIVVLCYFPEAARLRGPSAEPGGTELNSRNWIRPQ